MALEAAAPFLASAAMLHPWPVVALQGCMRCGGGVFTPAAGWSGGQHARRLDAWPIVVTDRLAVQHASCFWCGPTWSRCEQGGGLEPSGASTPSSSSLVVGFMSFTVVCSEAATAPCAGCRALSGRALAARVSWWWPHGTTWLPQRRAKSGLLSARGSRRWSCRWLCQVDGRHGFEREGLMLFWAWHGWSLWAGRFGAWHSRVPVAPEASASLGGLGHLGLSIGCSIRAPCHRRPRVCGGSQCAWPFPPQPAQAFPASARVCCRARQGP